MRDRASRQAENVGLATDITSLATERRIFAVRPRPFKCEATCGYLVRVASANGFASPNRLCAALHLSATGNMFDEFCRRACLSRQEQAWLFGPSAGRWMPTPMPPGFVAADFNQTIMRWCPRCFAESPYLHGQWSVKLCCVCMRHGVMLRESCHHCGRIQRLQRADIARCSCGARLDVSDTIVASNELLQFSSALEAALFESTPQPAFPVLDIGAWQRLCRYLGQFSECGTPARPGKVAGLHWLATASKVVSGAAHLLNRWPENFHTLLRSLQSKGTKTPSIRRTFGGLYRVLYIDLDADGFQFLRDAFESYVQLNWWGLVCERHRSFRRDTILEHPRVTVRQAASQARTTPAMVRHFVQMDLIAADALSLPSGRKMQAIHKDDIAKISALAGEAVNLTEAARLLALPKRRVRELVVEGVIASVVSRMQVNAASWLIPMRQIQQLSILPGSRKRDAALISLRQVMKYWRLREGECAALVRALRDGALVPVPAPHPSEVLGETRLDAGEVREWLRSSRMKGTTDLSIDQAADLLGIKQQAAYDLVRKGLLRATSSRSLGRRVSFAALREFQDTYVTLVELARERGCSTRHALNELTVRAVCGPTVDGSRQYFFRRDEVENGRTTG